MPDSRFFSKKGPFSLEEIAQIAEVSLPTGIDSKILIEDVSSLEQATEKDLSFAFIPSVRPQLSETKAKAVIIPEKFLNYLPAGTIGLISQDAHRSYGLIAQAFYPRAFKAGHSPRAFFSETAQIGQDCQIDSGAYIGENVIIGNSCHIEANAVIKDGVIIGNNCIIGSNSTISYCQLGHHVYIYPGAQIGQDGFGFAMSVKGAVKVPQLGRVIIGDDVEIGSNTTVDRGALGDTVIGSGTRIDNLVQVAHNVKIGRCCVLVSQVGIAGSCEFGDFVTCAGQSGFAGHLKIGTGSQIGAQSGVMKDIPAGATVIGSPALPKMDWVRQVLALQKLPQRSPHSFPLNWCQKFSILCLKIKEALKKKGN